MSVRQEEEQLVINTHGENFERNAIYDVSITGFDDGTPPLNTTEVCDMEMAEEQMDFDSRANSRNSDSQSECANGAASNYGGFKLREWSISAEREGSSVGLHFEQFKRERERWSRADVGATDLTPQSFSKVTGCLATNNVAESDDQEAWAELIKTVPTTRKREHQKPRIEWDWSCFLSMARMKNLDLFLGKLWAKVDVSMIRPDGPQIYPSDQWPSRRYADVPSYQRCPGPWFLDDKEEGFYVVDRVIGAVEIKDSAEELIYRRLYGVMWAGWPEEYVTLEPGENLNPDLIQEYLDHEDGFLPVSQGRKRKLLSLRSRSTKKMFQPTSEPPELIEIPVLKEILDSAERKYTLSHPNVRYSRGLGFRGKPRELAVLAEIQLWLEVAERFNQLLVVGNFIAKVANKIVGKPLRKASKRFWAKNGLSGIFFKNVEQLLHHTFRRPKLYGGLKRIAYLYPVIYSPGDKHLSHRDAEMTVHAALFCVEDVRKGGKDFTNYYYFNPRDPSRHAVIEPYYWFNRIKLPGDREIHYVDGEQFGPNDCLHRVLVFLGCVMSGQNVLVKSVKSFNSSTH